MGEKQEVETAGEHSALVMVRYRSDMTGQKSQGRQNFETEENTHSMKEKPSAFHH